MQLQKRSGFHKYEFQTLIGLSGQYGHIKDSRPMQDGDYITIYLHQCATKAPSIWIEKYQNGPKKDLFIAWTHSACGHIVSIARSEKFPHFLDQLRARLDLIDQSSTSTNLYVLA